MKVYVNKMPKSCSECEWFTPNHCSKDGRNFCLLARMPFCNTQEERQTTRGQHKDSLSDFDCPLQSLTDYTKQVRKEVVQEIRKYVDNYTKQHTGYYCDPYVNAQDLFEHLNQIQGETNE